MTNCDQIVIEATRLKTLFTECKSLKAMDTGGGVIKCPVWHNGTSWVSN